MSAEFDALDDPDGMFAAARRNPFTTPLFHWAMSWPEARRLPEAFRELTNRLTKGGLGKSVRVPGGFSFAPGWTWRTTTPAVERVQRGRWALLKTLLPVEWLSLLWGFDEPNALRVHVISEHELSFVLLMMRDGAPLAYATRDVDFRRHHVKHDFFVVARGLKGDGVGAQVIADALALYPRLGILEIGLVAGLTAGGSVWPRFGFRPVDADEWSNVKRTVRRNARTLPQAAWHAYVGGPPALDQALRRILADERPDAIWMLHKLDHGRQAAQAANLPHSVGDWLLQGSRWRGILELNDPLARSMARTYIQRKIDAGIVDIPPNW